VVYRRQIPPTVPHEKDTNASKKRLWLFT